MATSRKNGDERLVSRTYRAAIRIGEDFVTLEETITLPVDSTDEEIAQAVDLGMRIYTAQREAVEAQIAGIRETIGAPAPITVRDPDAPASEKQRSFIVNLQENLGWSSDQLTAYAGDHGVDLVTLTKGQASTFIDGLKRIAEERTTYGENARARGEPARREAEPAAARNGAAPANEKQIHALERLAQQHGLDLDMETRRRYGVVAHGMSSEQAGALLREWQPSSQNRKPSESVL